MAQLPSRRASHTLKDGSDERDGIKCCLCCSSACQVLVFVGVVTPLVKTLGHRLRRSQESGRLHCQVATKAICRLCGQAKLTLVTHHSERFQVLCQGIDVRLSPTNCSGRMLVQEVSPSRKLLLLDFGAESEVRSAFLNQFGDSGGVHLLEVDAHIPDRERRARWTTNHSVWFILGLELPMFLLAEAPRSTIIAHGP